VEPAGNHQVQDEPEIAFYSDRDALADSPDFAHDTALRIGERWLGGSKQERGLDSNALKRLAEDAWFECSDVGGDIRQLRHVYQLAGCAYGFATALYEAPRAHEASWGILSPVWTRLRRKARDSNLPAISRC
jgi:hypothetical protein